MSDIEYILEKHGENTDNPSIKIYVNKIENRIMFKIKTGCYLELLTPKTTKLLGSNKSKITKDKNDKYVPNLKITEIVLVHCNIFNNDYQQISRVLYTYIRNESFRQLIGISPKKFFLSKDALFSSTECCNVCKRLWIFIFC